jgi:hypothetical protein
MSRVTRLVCLATVLASAWAGVARADGPVGRDPSSNFRVGPLPPACSSAPTSPTCVGAAVAYLDAARANLGQPPYLLPSNFLSLTPEEQGFVLANLDRVLYGLPPITGITAALAHDAAMGVQGDTDPQPSDPSFNYWASNWAGGFPNLPLAYEAWMYDDGPGASNLDCPAGDSSGCWDHRHDILWSFDGTDPLAMGVAAGTDPAGTAGCAMLLGEGDRGYRPNYTYTWDQAVSAGANGGVSGSGSGSSGLGSASHGQRPTPASVPVGFPLPPTGAAAQVTILSIGVHGRRVAVRTAAPAQSTLRCALTLRRGDGWAADHFHACGRSAVYVRVRRGRYRLRVLTGSGSAIGYLRVR